MRWISDRQSAENSEITVLSIIETLLAGIIVYLFYRWTNTLWHIGIAACLAPFLLLGTSRSTELSLRTAEAVYRFVDNILDRGERYAAVFVAIGLPLWYSR